MPRFLVVCAALVALSDGKKAVKAEVYGVNDLYDDKDESKPSVYHHEIYPPKQEYHQEEPTYEKGDEYKEPYEPPYTPPAKEEAEYEEVYAEEEKFHLYPAAQAEALVVPPCKHNNECGMGICDITNHCRCMDHWWTPDPDDKASGRPCSVKRKSQAEAFLLQLFLGAFGIGCFYLGNGWIAFGAFNLFFTLFPCIVCVFACIGWTCCSCCVKACTCCGPPRPAPLANSADDKEDYDYDDNKEGAYRAWWNQVCGCILGFVAFCVWVASLICIANDCRTNNGVPCVPWGSD